MTAVSVAGLRALTVRQPWAALLAIGAKQWETRTRPIPAAMARVHGSPVIAIHAGMARPIAISTGATEPDDTSVRLSFGTYCDLDSDPIAWTTGAVLAVARITDCRPVEDVRAGLDEQRMGDWSPGRHAWRIADVVRLPEPVPCRGQLGLWRLPPDVAAQVEAQVAGQWERVPW